MLSYLNKISELDEQRKNIILEVEQLKSNRNEVSKLIGKELADMTEEEYIASSHFRSELLEASVVDPYFTAEEWRTLVDNGTVTALYDEVNKILTSADDSALFQ